MRYGFSLVELSIVLVILGLLTGGILSGQNLIRAAELRSVVAEFRNYQTAVMTFQDQHLNLPGDIPNAIDYWGAPGGNIANCPATAGTGTETCNGNGDGSVIRTTSSASQYVEEYLFWQHLGNAGLIPSKFSGLAGPINVTDSVIRENTPPSKLSDAGWETAFWNVDATNTDAFSPMNYNHYFRIGADEGDQLGKAVMSPKEAWNIDAKIDDGKPGYGNVIGLHWDDACANATSSSDYDADYNLDRNSIECALYFRNAY